MLINGRRNGHEDIQRTLLSHIESRFKHEQQIEALAPSNYCCIQSFGCTQIQAPGLGT